MNHDASQCVLGTRELSHPSHRHGFIYGAAGWRKKAYLHYP